LIAFCSLRLPDGNTGGRFFVRTDFTAPIKITHCEEVKPNGPDQH
jgi:hypothetical protein